MNDMKPLITIVTITKDDYNGAKATIQSLEELAEVMSLEQIIVDASYNLDAQQLKSYCRKLKHVKYFPQLSSGRSNAFNEGIARATGKWIWFLNGGDKLKGAIKHSTLKDILQTSKAHAIFFLNDSGGIVDKFPSLSSLWPIYFNWVSHPSAIFRTEVLTRKRPLFLSTYKIAMDQELWVRFLGSLTVDMLNIALVDFDLTGISSRQLSKRAREVARISTKSFPSNFCWSTKQVLRSFLMPLWFFFQSMRK